MTITLVRVDDRVIHGQTMTRWSKERPIDGFLVVGDQIIQDTLRKKVLKAAAGNYKLGIYADKEGPEKIKKGMESSKNFFLISNSPQTFAKLVKNGANFGNELNVGPMNTREGALVVGRTLAIDDRDYEAFEYLNGKGIKIYFQLIPDEEKKSWKEVKAKYDSMKGKGD
ncbi:PTS system mannose/fructose/N-acetylgalactosamine-transporter subunit IIB [Companilactobacillus zhachilii]|uniref:PTS system mannose/fructose/N-acetylgalactosamine-transporter subunit IIB n=1 Tax=Companilactobacillus zhachilii TaxID=2304606 RepID=UPI004033CC84